MCRRMNICMDIKLTNCLDIVRELNRVKRDVVVIAVGEMSIEYTGRASSYAYPAYRLLVIKPDGTLLIHESTRIEPLNWQPPKSTTYFECVENRLRARSVRESPREEVIIEFNDVVFVKMCKLASTKLSVIGRELDVVKVVLSNPSIIEENTLVVGSDIPTTYGKIDVLLRKDDKLIVVEVKNEKAGIPAVVQLKRYVEYYVMQGQKAEGVLIAPDISHEALAMLIREGFKYIDFNTLKSKTKFGETLERFIKMGKGKQTRG